MISEESKQFLKFWGSGGIHHFFHSERSINPTNKVKISEYFSLVEIIFSSSNKDIFFKEGRRLATSSARGAIHM